MFGVQIQNTSLSSAIYICVAISYNSHAGRDKTIPFYRFPGDMDRKKMDSSNKQRLREVQT